MKCPREETGRAGASYGDDFIPHEVKANDLRLALRVKMTATRIADLVVELESAVGLCEGRPSNRSGGISTLGRFLHEIDYLGRAHRSRFVYARTIPCGPAGWCGAVPKTGSAVPLPPLRFVGECRLVGLCPDASHECWAGSYQIAQVSHDG